VSDSRYLEQHWFVVALSDQVRSRPQRVVVFGKPIVLVRSSEGSVWALEDRCPHRGAPLSAGRLQGHGIVCPYHGWTFDGDGRCTATPGAVNPMGDFRVPAFRVLERDGLVWLTTGATARLPERVTAMNPERQRFVQQMRWGAPIIDAQENFLDALHTHTVHPGLVRQANLRRPVDVTLRVAGDGFVVDYAGQADQSGLLFRLFESPRVSERAYFSALSVGQIEYRYANGCAIWITLHFTPEAASSTHVFATLHVEGRWAPRWLVRWLVWPFLRKVAQQDQTILEQKEALRAYFPGRRPMITQLDIARPYLDAAWNGGEQSLPKEIGCRLQL
jgi:phenylpropionate dioxygenase-like ring-hydroxylating dioxygenase large terminal subunit